MLISLLLQCGNDKTIQHYQPSPPLLLGSHPASRSGLRILTTFESLRCIQPPVQSTSPFFHQGCAILVVPFFRTNCFSLDCVFLCSPVRSHSRLLPILCMVTNNYRANTRAQMSTRNWVTAEVNLIIRATSQTFFRDELNPYNLLLQSVFR